MAALIDMKAARKRLAQKRHGQLVLSAWDQMEHQAKREQAEKRAEIERNARNKI